MNVHFRTESVQSMSETRRSCLLENEVNVPDLNVNLNVFKSYSQVRIFYSKYNLLNPFSPREKCIRCLEKQESNVWLSNAKLLMASWCERVNLGVIKKMRRFPTKCNIILKKKNIESLVREESSCNCKLPYIELNVFGKKNKRIERSRWVVFVECS